MARITQLLDAGPTLSFEFSAPRDEEGAERLRRTLARLSTHRPHFMSVTYGAGGTTRGPTRDWVQTIRDDFQVEAMPHLTCVAHSRDEVADIIKSYQSDRIENILALRGDLPHGAQSSTQAFDTAAQLVDFIRQRADWDIGVAAHPEGHPMAASVEADLAHQTAKLRQADFAITQFGYRAEYYEQFVNQLDARGVETPVIPGIMPPTNVAGIERMSALNGTEFPTDIRDRLEAASGAAQRREIGVEVAAHLGRELLELGAPGLHIYTMNFARAASEVAAALGWTAD
ncbi:MAG: methylenetetrahydrofolate reductase [Chloroflexota bacterium]|nr:methylenetetrahydrofolate reductase [Chloroflexota bacterium]